MIGAGGLASLRQSCSHRVHSRAQSRARPCPCNAPAHDEGLFAQTRAEVFRPSKQSPRGESSNWNALWNAITLLIIK